MTYHNESSKRAISKSHPDEVVNFLDCYVGAYHWPAFNVANSAVTLGALMLLVSLLRGE